MISTCELLSLIRFEVNKPECFPSQAPLFSCLIDYFGPSEGRGDSQRVDLPLSAPFYSSKTSACPQDSIKFLNL